MRLVVYSDLHLNTWTYESSLDDDGRNTRLQLQRNVLKQIERYCLNNDIKTIVCCGDIYHTHGTVDSEVLSIAYEAFSSMHRAGLDQIWLVGNHDQKDKAGRIHSLDFLRPFGKVIDNEGHKNIEGVPLSFLAYTEDKNKLQKFFDDVGRHSDSGVCFIHQGVAGVPMPHGFLIEEIFTPDMVPDRIRHVFSGHYHTHKRVNDKITIPGSPMQHTWGDIGGKRGWLDVTIDPGCIVSYTHVESIHPQFSVDWIRKVKKEDKKTISIGPSNFSSLDSLVQNFCSVNSLTPHQVRIGKELRDDKYEVPGEPA